MAEAISDPWSEIVWDGKRIPGPARVRGARVPIAKLQPFEIDVLFGPKNAKAVQRFVDAVWSDRRMPPRPHAIVHPALLLSAIREAVVVGIGLPQDGPIPGTKWFTLRCMEHRRAKRKKVRRG